MKRRKAIKSSPNIVITEQVENPVMTMIVPGRRALGEEWSKVSVFPDEETKGYRIEREDTKAPADSTAIFVPGMGNISIEMADYILERKRQDQEYRKNHNLPIKTNYTQAEIQRMFHDYMEQVIKRRKGITQIGPGGWTQREGI